MAYNTDNEKRTDIKSIEKNKKGDYLYITRIDDKSNKQLKAVDVRNYYTDKNEEVAPTQKGVRINAEAVAEVLSSIMLAADPEDVERAVEMYQEEGGKAEVKLA